MGVDTIKTFVDCPDEIVGYTESKNSSAKDGGSTCANSSRKITLNEDPLTADDDVAAAITLLPFSNSILPLFQTDIPCCNQDGKCSNDICNLLKSSLASEPLFARIPTCTLSLKSI